MALQQAYQIMGASQVMGRAAQMAPYESKLQHRISIPITTNTLRNYPAKPDGNLEMTIGTDGEWVEFTMLVQGKQSVHFRAHRADLAGITSELTLAGLSK